MTDQDALIVSHLDLARRLARTAARKTPNVSPDEMESAAYMGLVKAARRFDGTSPFPAYATLRIRGEMVDYLREIAWGPRRCPVRPGALPDLPAEPAPDSFNDLFDGLTAGLESRQMLWQYFGKNETIRQVAASAGMSPSTACGLIRAGVRQMRRRLTPEDYGYHQ